MLSVQIHLNLSFLRAFNHTNVIKCLRLNFKLKPVLQTPLFKRRSHTDDYFQFDFFFFYFLGIKTIPTHNMLFTEMYLQIEM